MIEINSLKVLFETLYIFSGTFDWKTESVFLILFGFSCSNVFQLKIYGLKSEYLMYSYFISKALKVQIEYKCIDSNYTYTNCTDEQLHGNSNEKLECVVYFNLDFNYVQITRVSNW